MPAPSTKGRQKSTRPILEFLERGAQRKGKSIREITFEEFMNSPAMGFGGAGAIKAVRGLVGTGLGARVAGKELFKPGASFEAKAALTGKRANIDRPNTIAGGELRKNVGGQRPPDKELEALALKKQQVKALRRQGLKLKTRVFEIMRELDLLKKQGLGVKESRRALALQKELRKITAPFLERE